MIFSIRKPVRILSFLLLAGAAALPATAQKCKYDVDKTDPFSKEQVRSKTLKIGPETINTRKNREVGWTMTFENKGQDHFIGFKLIMLGKLDDVMATGQKAYLRLADDKIITLVADVEVLPAYLTGIAVYTHYNLRFKTEAESIAALSAAPVTDFKLETGNQEITAELGKKGTQIMETAACFR